MTRHTPSGKILVKTAIWSAFLFLVLFARGQNTNISNGLFFEGEPYLAVNPVNPQHLVVSWMGYSFGQPLGIKTIVSFNGGQSWSSPAFQPHFSPSSELLTSSTKISDIRT